MLTSPPRLDFWRHLLSPRTVLVVDVGAMALPAPESYQLLLEHDLAEVVAFEPNPAGCAELNAGSPRRRCLPWAIGDGRPRQFHLNAVAYTSSFYPANLELLASFGYADSFRTLQIAQIETRRLDDIAEIRDCDLLKIDVQGAELDVLSGAHELLAGVTVVQTELAFVPLYLGQPLFGAVDLALRRQGFLLHRIDTSLRASWLVERLPQHKSQLLWSDVVYLRNPTRLSGFTPQKLLNMALILDLCYDSADAAARVLQVYDRLTGKDLLPDFLQQVRIS